MYIELEMLYEYNMALGSKLIEELLRCEEYYCIYSRYLRQERL